MATSSLHTSVKQLAGNKPALVFSFEALKSLFIFNIQNTKNLLLNKSLPFDGMEKISSCLIDFSIEPTDFSLHLSEKSQSIFLECTTEVVLTISIHSSANKNDQFSKIELTINNLSSRLTLKAPYLIIGNPDVNFDVNLVPDPNRESAIINSQIDEKDVEKVEGALAYIIPRKIAMMFFQSIGKIDITQMFTAFDLKGDWQMYNTLDNHLVIIPSNGISFKENNGCPLVDNLPDMTVNTGNRKTENEVEMEGTYSWPIQVGGVPNVIVRNASVKDGFASILLPETVLEERFSKVLPGFVYTEEGTSFIDFDFTVFGGFSYVKLAIDSNRNGFIVEFDILLSGNGSLYADIPCLGKFDLGSIRLNTETSTIKIYISTVYSPSGRLRMDAQIDDIKIGKANVTVSFFARWLLFFLGGIGIVVGFIMDSILGGILGRIIPNKLRDIVKNKVNSQNIQLLDLESIEKYSKYKKLNDSTYSADTDSILVGLAPND